MQTASASASASVLAADSPPAHTGQNAETRSNGAALGRTMMLFITPVLNMPGAAGFSAKGGLVYCILRGKNRQHPGEELTALDLVPKNKFDLVESRD